jgi:hypothetical protein
LELPYVDFTVRKLFGEKTLELCNTRVEFFFIALRRDFKGFLLLR